MARLGRDRSRRAFYSLNAVNLEQGLQNTDSIEALEEEIAQTLKSTKVTAFDYAKFATSDTQGRSNLILEAVRRIQTRLLENYMHTLHKKSNQLNGHGCWAFLWERLPEAQKYGVEEELGHLVFQAAGEHADPRMLLVCRKYHRLRR